jgi:hypothetical protein
MFSGGTGKPNDEGRSIPLFTGDFDRAAEQIGERPDDAQSQTNPAMSARP